MSQKFLLGIDVAGSKITSVGAATLASDVPNYGQLQAAINGLAWHPPVRTVATSNLGLSGLAAIDGITPVAGDRVLATAQTTASQNLIYVAAAGAWTVAADSQNGELANGHVVEVGAGGTTYASSLWQITTIGAITVGTTSISWTQKPNGTGQTYTNGAGLSLTGSTFAVNAGAGIIADGASTRLDPTSSIFLRKQAYTLPAGSTSTVVAHTLNTQDIAGVQLYDMTTTPPTPISSDWVPTSTTSITITTPAAVTTNQYRVVIEG